MPDIANVQQQIAAVIHGRVLVGHAHTWARSLSWGYSHVTAFSQLGIKLGQRCTVLGIPHLGNNLQVCRQSQDIIDLDQY